MEAKSVFDRNLLFGERHDEPLLRDFLVNNLQALSQKGYRLLVVEINATLPIGNMIDERFPNGTTVQQMMDAAHEMVSKHHPDTKTLLAHIEKAFRR